MSEHLTPPDAGNMSCNTYHRALFLTSTTAGLLRVWLTQHHCVPILERGRPVHLQLLLPCWTLHRLRAVLRDPVHEQWWTVCGEALFLLMR